MAEGSNKTWALALALAPALWALPGARPAVAHPSGDPACYLPPFTPLVSPCVPHDTPAGPGATVADLAFFAWQEFIALNWVAMDPATTGIRGRPAPDTDPNAGFFGVAPDSQGNFPLVVWQSYRHKNELFPYGVSTDPVFDSPMPSYRYQIQPTPAGGQIPSFNLFNNLDETSEIGLANMYAHASSAVQPPSTGPGAGPATGIRVAYEAKVNRAVFQYLADNGLTKLVKDPTTGRFSYPALNTARSNTAGFDPTTGAPYLANTGGICSPPTGTNPQPIVLLPCGDINVPGDPGEGAIEIKAAWRQLTPAELSSGRFFTRNVIFYTGAQGNQRYNNAVWGLIALHIIHKTKSFPAFVFATWEQVDNYVDEDPADPNPETLAFQNLPLPEDRTASVPNIAVTRAHPIHPDVAATNDSVHAVFKAASPGTIWQYYKLVGVQAAPVNGPLQPPPGGTASPDALSYYYLANIVVETNQALQNFFGKVGDDGLPKTFENVYLHGAAGSPFVMGGCQGCHGFQGQNQGGDMSVLIAAAGENAQQAESIDALPARSTRTVIHRNRGLLHDDGHSIPEFEGRQPR